MMYGDPKVTTGGNALKFYASIRMEMARKKVIVGGDGTSIGHEVRVKVLKNKTAVPFQVAETALFYGIGFDRELELLKICEETGIFAKKGSWYWYGETRLGNGVDNTLSIMRDNYELCQELRTKLNL